ncbi:MAG: T9SS type A sorting domain-containing protein [Phycisphaerae bacterium]|nr:T9SS type A sorting domain-containing protein [Saprospiraceae bacterium]
MTGNHGSYDYWIVKLAPEPVGVDDLFTQAGNLEIFPNPASNAVSLSISAEEPSFNLVISDLLGREISQQTVPNGGLVDVSTLDNGLYLLTATTPQGQVYFLYVSNRRCFTVIPLFISCLREPTPIARWVLAN